jgi:hypothetical protein
MSDNQNVDEFGNPYNEEMGQSNESIGQDEQVDTQSNPDKSWEDQAKYFQSEKDKLQAENQKLSKYKEIGSFLESRPDIVKDIINKTDSGQPTTQSQPLKTPNDFDPWEAYNDPSSASYKFRMQEMQSAISNSVSKATQGIKEQTGKNELSSQLASKGMNNAEIDSFMEFASKHPAEYGLDNVIKMWQSVSEGTIQQNNNPLDQVRENQNQPQTAGVLAGERPKGPKTDNDSMWDGIMQAGSRKNVL